MVINLQRVITVVVIGTELNDQGGSDGVVVDSWTRRAMIENRTGSNSSPYDQQLWTNRRIIWVRHERTRPIKQNYVIYYEGQWLKIETISIRNERAKMYDRIECSNVDLNITLPDES